MKDVLITYDYYAYGSVMPGRNGNSGDYRYGFNGMEKDDEVSGNGNSYDYGARMYNPRIGRWFATDGFKAIYPSISPYSYGLNNPILNIDEEGNFVIEGTTEEKAMLQKFVAAAKKALVSDPYLLDRLLLHSGLTEDELDFIFTDNKGPVLKFENIADNGYFRSPQYTSAFLEQAPGVNSSSFQLILNDDFFNNIYVSSDPHQFFITATILHELVHLGDRRDGKEGNLDYKGLEEKGVFRQGFTTIAKEESKGTAVGVNGIEAGKAFEVDIAKYDINSDNLLKTRFNDYKRNSKRDAKGKSKEGGSSMPRPPSREKRRDGYTTRD